MNFLAHQHLSFLNPPLCVGNFIADFLRGKEIEEVNSEVAKGIALHRFIDEFTDSHPIIQECIQRIEPYQGRYKAVVLDVYLDYFLANNWQLFNETNLQTFSKQTYQIFKNHKHWFPAKTHPALNSITTNDWLTNYQYEEGLKHSFANIQKRVSFDNNLDAVIPHLKELKAILEPMFLNFYPDILSAVKEFILENNYREIIK